MSEQSEDPAVESSSGSQLNAPTPPETATPALSRVEERLAKATSPEDVVLWTQVRAELLRQNEMTKEGEHRRTLEKIQVARKVGLSGVALSIGTVLVITGLTYPLILGVGLYDLAPDLLKEALGGRGKGGKND